MLIHRFLLPVVLLACTDKDTTDNTPSDRHSGSVADTDTVDTDPEDTDSEDTGPPGVAIALTSKSKLYQTTSSAVLERYTREAYVAWCNDRNDIVISGGCSNDGTTSLNLMASGPVNATDEEEIAGWSCTWYVSGNSDQKVEGYAICLTIE